MPSPFNQRPEYQENVQAWNLVSDLLEGTRAFLRNRDRWLTRYGHETPRDYQVRTERVFVLGAFSDAVGRIASKPFSRPISIDPWPDEYQYLERHANRMNETLHAVLQRHFERKVAYGVSYILADMPDADDSMRTPTGAVSVAARDRGGLRPYLSLVHPESLIGWEVEADGTPTEVRIRRVRWELDGDKYREVEYVHVLRNTTVELWRRFVDQATTTETLVFERPNELGRIPLVADYADASAPFVPIPPMEDLAWANLAHVRSWLEQRQALAFARAGILYELGVPEEYVNAPLFAGPGLAIRRTATPAEADLRFVEPPGVGVAAGQADLDALVDLMQTLGSQPMTRRSGNATATGRVMDESKTESVAQSWVRTTEVAASRALQLIAEWENRDWEPDVDIFQDFSALSDRAMLEYERIQDDRKGGVISRSELLRQGKRRGVYDEQLDIEETLAEADEEKVDAVPIVPHRPPVDGEFEADLDEDEEEAGAQDESEG